MCRSERNKQKMMFKRVTLPHQHITHPLEFDLEIERLFRQRNSPGINAKIENMGY